MSDEFNIYPAEHVNTHASVKQHADSLKSYMQPIGPTGTEARVCQDIAQRQQAGRQKYGATVEENLHSMRETLQHAYEEALDLAIYLRRQIELLDQDPSREKKTTTRGT